MTRRALLAAPLLVAAARFVAARFSPLTTQDGRTFTTQDGRVLTTQ